MSRRHPTQGDKAARLPGPAFAALASVPFVMVLSNSLLVPVLPTIREELGISYFRAGLLITAFSAAAALTIPVAGLLSDRFGRKAVMVPALVLFGLGGFLAGMAGWLSREPYRWLLWGRVLQGIGGGGTYQIALALAGDALGRPARAGAMGALEAANALGKVVSPILGGAAALWRWFAPFFVYPLLAWASAAAVAGLVPEPASRRRSRSWRSYARSLRRIAARRGASLLAALAAGGLMLFFLFGALSWFSDHLERRFGFSQLYRGLILAVPLLVAAATSWAVGQVWLRRSPGAARAAVLLGTGTVGAALVLLSAAAGWGAGSAVAVLVGLGAGYGLALPAVNGWVTGAAGAAQRGLVTAVYGTVRFLGAALGPPAFELALNRGPRAFLFLAGLAALVWGLVWWKMRAEPRREPGLSWD